MFSDKEMDFIQTHHKANTLKFTAPKSGPVYDLTQKIIDATPYVDASWKSAFKYRLWHIINDVGQATCKECGSPVTPTLYNGFNWDSPYPETCSPHCDFIRRSKKVHGDTFDYHKTKYVNAHGKVMITCPSHGDFEQIAHNHLNGSGCIHCRNESFKTNYLKSQEDRIDEFRAVHGDRYDYSKTSIEGNSHQHITVTCNDHGDFLTTPLRHAWSGHGCPKCSYSEGSSQEQLIRQMLDDHGIDYEQNDRTVLDGQELDIYIPSHHLAIEINGIYWHSTKFRDKWFHLNKSNDCAGKGVELLHFYDIEVDHKPEVVKSMIMARLGYAHRIHARKCRVVMLDSATSQSYQAEHHLYNPIHSVHRYGLEHDGMIVALMTFSHARTSAYGDDVYELVRYVNHRGYRVIGGASKLLKAFERDVQPTKMVTYSDLRYSHGKLYRALGFEHSHNSEPSPKYWKDKKHGLVSRNRLQKHKLVDLPAYRNDKPADMILAESGFHKIYDCGHGVWTKH